MDGFRERMGRGASDRFDRMDRGDRYDDYRSERYDDSRYDRFDDSRYDRGPKRGGYGQSAPQGPSISPDEIAQIVDDSNANQIGAIGRMAEETKNCILDSEKNIKSSIDILKDAISGLSDDVADTIKNMPAPQVINEAPQVSNDAQDEIIRLARDNNDLLAQFAEDQVAMLVRGNSSMLSQINSSLDAQDDLLRQILNNASTQSPVAPMMAPSSNDEEVLQTALNNNTLLNALRAEVAGLQNDLRDAQMNKQQDDNGPLDATPATKEEMDILYRDMEEHVHKECVKVYKNVQAALEAQNTTVSESVKKENGGLKFLIIFNLILSVLNILVAVAGALGLIS